MCDIRALSRKALLAVLDKFPEEEEPLSLHSAEGGQGALHGIAIPMSHLRRMMAIVEAHSQSRKARQTWCLRVHAVTAMSVGGLPGTRASQRRRGRLQSGLLAESFWWDRWSLHSHGPR